MRKQKPTIKQKIAVQGVLAGKKPANALREARYSETSVQNPGRLFKSAGVQNYLSGMDKYSRSLFKASLDSLIQKTSVEGIKALKRDQFTGEVTPDWKVRDKYIERVLKIKGIGQYQQKSSNQQFNFFNFDTEQREKISNKVKDFVKDLYKEL